MPESSAKADREWTVSSLKELFEHRLSSLEKHIDQKFAEADKRYEQRFSATQTAMSAALAAQQKAVEVAESVGEKWRQNANEWRATLSDRDKKFMMEETARAELKVYDARIRSVEEKVKIGEGRGAGIKDMTGWLFGAIGIGVAIAAIVFRQIGK